ncbi:type II toxin-antitoxin system HicB family antitoxin [Thioalkalivibrio sp. AKL17]|uniref:type II toxin-antitoxin system HicB family antitoxin n=1 Tax=Thioalkalivibrio sp. AKL17 TaxID=1158160 RepID=UPI00036BA699|nr:type II toxin-antitoxin system HicB family antitoxin [Thioalkalivibrio sp. AKL17]
MRYAYPVQLERDEGGHYLATCRDVPEALTDGESQEEALREMGEALGAALAGYVMEGRPIPSPTDAEPGEAIAPVSPLIAAKLALRVAMRAEGVSNSELAHRMGSHEGAIRRLIDVDHRSRIEAVHAAIASLGHGLVVEDARPFKPVAA